MKPYYEHGGITIYHGDCREILPRLPKADLCLTDPPYGIGADANQSKRANKQHGNAAAPSRDYGLSDWDSISPDDVDILKAVNSAAKAIVWGGNYFHFKPSRAWLVWDKDNGDNGYADCELAWSNLDMAVRKFRHRWMGMIQENMAQKEIRFHPTQKPLALMSWCLSFAPDAQAVVDPYAGSCTVARACKDLGKRCISIEREEKYCEVGALRLSQEVFAL